MNESLKYIVMGTIYLSAFGSVLFFCYYQSRQIMKEVDREKELKKQNPSIGYPEIKIYRAPSNTHNNCCNNNRCNNRRTSSSDDGPIFPSAGGWGI